MDRIKELYIKYKEIISYLFWGVMTTVVSWGSYSACILLFGKMDSRITVFDRNVSMGIFLASLLSWICAVAFAYVTNKIWVFHSKVKEPAAVLKEAAKFVSSRAATGVLEVLGVPFLILLGMDQKIFGIDGMLAKMVVSVIVVIANYVLSKWLVFNNKKPETRH